MLASSAGEVALSITTTPRTLSPRCFMASSMQRLGAVGARLDDHNALQMQDLLVLDQLIGRRRPGCKFPPFPIGIEVPRDEPMHMRSDEHTSALQSLMRTSYAVFRLKNT